MELWGFENQRSLPGHGAGLFQTTPPPNPPATEAIPAAAAPGMSPWLPIMMGVGMISQSSASVANTLMTTSAQVNIANAQANAMMLSTQAQANATIFNAQTQANVAIQNSNNQLTAAQDHNDVMRTQIQENSLTAKFALMTSLAERLDQNFTAVQIATRGAQIAEREESNRHREAMESLRLQEMQLDRPTVNTQDLLGRFT